MKCPHCGALHETIGSEVLNSRPREYGIYRRRRCCMCHERFSTHESIVEDPIDKAKVSALLKEAEAFIQRARIELKCD